MLHYSILDYTMRYSNTIFFYSILYYPILYYAVLYYNMPGYALLAAQHGVV